MTFLDNPIPGGHGGPKFIPSEGLHNAILVHIGDMGEVLKDFPGSPPKIIHGIKFFVQLDELMPEAAGEYAGEPFMLSTDGAIALSKNSKSTLFKWLKAWRGKEIPPKGIPEGYTLRPLIGQQLSVTVEHVEKTDGTLRAKIAAFGPKLPGAAALTSRFKQEPEWFGKVREENAAKVAEFLSRQNFGKSASKQPASAEGGDDDMTDGNGLAVPF